MAMNRIQFQPGLSLPAFLLHFGTEAQCAATLQQARWPHGFRCPRCDQVDHYCARQSLEEEEESQSDVSNQKPLTATRRVRVPSR